MYGILTEKILKKKKEVAVSGEVSLEDDSIFLVGVDGYKVLLCFTGEEENQKHELSEYEGETIILYGEVIPAGIKVMGYSTFKKPLDIDLYRKTIEEINKHSELFCKEADEES